MLNWKYENNFNAPLGIIIFGLVSSRNISAHLNQNVKIPDQSYCNTKDTLKIDGAVVSLNADNTIGSPCAVTFEAVSHSFSSNKILLHISYMHISNCNVKLTVTFGKEKDPVFKREFSCNNPEVNTTMIFSSPIVTIQLNVHNATLTHSDYFQVILANVKKECKSPDWDIVCKNGFCVSKDLLCDGFNHCFDGSDEIKDSNGLCYRDYEYLRGGQSWEYIVCFAFLLPTAFILCVPCLCVILIPAKKNKTLNKTTRCTAHHLSSRENISLTNVIVMNSRKPFQNIMIEAKNDKNSDAQKNSLTIINCNNEHAESQLCSTLAGNVSSYTVSSETNRSPLSFANISEAGVQRILDPGEIMINESLVQENKDDIDDTEQYTFFNILNIFSPSPNKNVASDDNDDTTSLDSENISDIVIKLKQSKSNTNIQNICSSSFDNSERSNPTTAKSVIEIPNIIPKSDLYHIRNFEHWNQLSESLLQKHQTQDKHEEATDLVESNSKELFKKDSKIK